MEEIDIKELVLLLWKKKIFIIIITIMLGLITFLAFCNIYNLKQNVEIIKNPQTLYYAQTTLIVGTSETFNTTYEEPITDDTATVSVTSKSRISQTDTFIDTYREIIKSKTSLNKIIDNLNLDIGANTLSNQISFSRVSDSDLLCLIVAYKDEEKVLQIANALVNEFIENMSNAYSLDQVSIIDEAYILSNADIANASAISQIVTDSTTAKSSIDKTLKFTLVAMFVGFILSISIVLIIEMFDVTIKNEDDFRQLTNSNKIITIDKNKDNKNHFNLLKVSLENSKTILITSPEINNNLKYISNGLADLFTQTKNNVLLLDFASDESVLTKKYTFKSLLEFVKNKNNDISKLVVKTPANNFDTLFIDTATDNCLSESEQKKVLNSLTKIYDTVIVSSDNILENAYSRAIAKTIKSTVVLVEERKTKKDDFIKAKEYIENVTDYILVK